MSSQILLQLVLFTSTVTVFSKYQYLLVEVGKNEIEKHSNGISNEGLIPSNNSTSNSINPRNSANKLGKVAFRKDLRKATNKPDPKKSK